ncbi:hypothetical protein [Georgenia sunbinii]|uniref:hypothetical protein n=1 Tax=Georgenia sunbinii TaxID=3117728 RepID=UPI002F26D8C4
MANSAASPQPHADAGPPVHEHVAAELARALAAAQREIYWLRQERRRLLGADPPADADPGEADADGPPVADVLLDQVARAAVPVTARRLAIGEARSESTTWDRLTDAVREIYLERARAAVEAVVPVFVAALEAIPGMAEVRLAQHRLGLPTDSGLAELLEHARAEGGAQVLNDVAHDVEARNVEHEALRQAIQAVELVIVDGEHMAASHSSAVAVEVAEWFTDRLRRSLAAPDVTLSDALAAEREQVLLAVAEQLGYTGIAALTWYTEMSNRIDAGPPG